jgi:hypothetical protein
MASVPNLAGPILRMARTNRTRIPKGESNDHH